MISADWEEEEPGVLLQMIIEHWATVHGFLYTSAFLEKYKQANKKTVQKLKGTWILKIEEIVIRYKVPVTKVTIGIMFADK